MDHKIGGSRVAGEDVLKMRVRSRLWFFDGRTRNVNYLGDGDQVLFYVGGRGGGRFAGRCVIEKAPRGLTQMERRLTEGLCEGHNDLMVELGDVEVWRKAKPISDLLPTLSFIKNKKAWRAYFQGSIIATPSDDYDRVVSRSSP